MRKKLLTIGLALTGFLGVQAQELTDSLLMYYPFSGNAMDMSGNDFHGTEMGNVSLTTDRFGNIASAYRFDGIDDYINIPHDNGFKKDLPITISLWAKHNDRDIVGQIFKTDNHPSTYFGVNLNSSNGLASSSFMNGLGAGSQYRKTIHSSDSIPNGVWRHYVVVLTSAADIKMYVDGVRDTSAILSGSGSSLAYSTSDGAIGYSLNPWGAPYYFDGEVDDIMLWNRALDSLEVENLHNASSESALAMIDINNGGVCMGESLDINITNTVDDVQYTLYLALDSSTVDSAMGGSDIMLNTGNLTSATDYVIYAENDVLADGLGTSLMLEQTSNRTSFGPFSVPSSEYTIEFWMNDTNNTTHFGRIFCFNSTVYQLALLDDKRLAFSNNGAWQYPNASDTLIDKNEWNHIAISVGSGQYSLYVNGNLYMSNSINNITSFDFRFGHGGNTTAGILVDELKIYDYAKTQNQIVDKMRHAINPNHVSGVLGYYQFEEGMGSMVYNLADTTNHGEIIAMDTVNTWVSGLHHNTTDYTFTANVGTPASLSSSLDETSGNIDLIITGGVAPFTFDWDNDGTGDFDDSEDLTGIETGTYSVTAIDAYGCESTHQVSITVDGILNNIDEIISVYPNPSSQFLNIDLSESNKANYRIISLTGSEIMNGKLVKNSRLNVSDLESGIYFLEIEIDGTKMVNKIVKK